MIALAVIFIGFAISKRLINRLIFLKSFLCFVERIKTQIRFNSADLYNLLNADMQHRELNEFLKKCRDNMQKNSFYNSWSIAINCIPKTVGLTRDDIEIMRGFATVLGTTDIDGQLAHCELYISLIKQKIVKVKEEKEQKVKLYRSLGLSVGACVFILVI